MKSNPVVFIVDDEEAIRRSLSMLLRTAGHETRTFDSAQDFLDTYDPSQPGCLILDVRMPGMSGLELQDALNTHGCTLPVILITGHGDVPMAVRAVKRGAYHFLEKPFRNEELLEYVATCLESDHEQRQNRAAIEYDRERLARLTRREREIMDLVARGLLNKQVAAELGISVRTVEAHRARIMQKLDAGSVSELVRLAMLDD
jgi:FixJ family two-component response regulator